jgi:hypothetical protein
MGKKSRRLLGFESDFKPSNDAGPDKVRNGIAIQDVDGPGDAVTDWARRSPRSPSRVRRSIPGRVASYQYQAKDNPRMPAPDDVVIKYFVRSGCGLGRLHGIQVALKGPNRSAQGIALGSESCTASQAL